MVDSKNPTTNYQLPTTAAKPLVVVVGPTASGKSSLAMELAKKFHGEIICADSRTIYKGMDIGTAKPSKREQEEVPHHMLDIVNPDQAFTAAEFKRRALLWIDDISIRGRLPIMVGGTGLYIDGVIFDYAFLPPVPNEEREQLQALTVEQLQQKILDQGLSLPENSKNPRHLIRTIETNGAVPVKKGLRQNTLVIGLDVPKEELVGRINHRIKEMLDKGLEAEAATMASKYGWDAPGLSAVGYREWREFSDRNKTNDEIASRISKSTIEYAKRQRTWFKRNQSIKWVKNSAEAYELVNKFLQS